MKFFVILSCGTLLAPVLFAQDWPQWGQNSRHTGTVTATAQNPEVVLGQFTYDKLADQIRQDAGGELLVHYMAPLVDATGVIVMSRGASTWISCRSGQTPCGSARWPQMQWGITRLEWAGTVTIPRERPRRTLTERWTAISTWKPAPDNGTGWEPVFHPAVNGTLVWMPGGAGSVIRLDRATGAVIDTLQPFAETDPNRYITSPLTIDSAGAVYYTVIRFDAASPWANDVKEAWLVKIDADGHARKVSFADLTPGAPVSGCAITFSGNPLPWPPSPDAKPPVTACGSQRPGLNAAPAIAPDGTVYVVSRAHLNAAYSYLTAAASDLTPKWSASLRNRLNDGCGVLLPPNGTVGGCRQGTAVGVDPTTNDLPAGQVEDESTASPVVAPDGSILYGALTRYNYLRGHLMRFTAEGSFRAAYDFGWDITPAVFAHDGTWSVILKDNFYGIGSYCFTSSVCGQEEAHYNITSLTPDLRPEWSYRNTNDQLCNLQPDGTVSCTAATEAFEWCVNMVAVDSNGSIYANSEDGNLYALDRHGNLIGRKFLKAALGAAYTPLSIGSDGVVYTQNDGTLFAIGSRTQRSPGR